MRAFLFALPSTTAPATVFYDPVEIGYTGTGEKPDAVVITVIASTSGE